MQCNPFLQTKPLLRVSYLDRVTPPLVWCSHNHIFCTPFTHLMPIPILFRGSFVVFVKLDCKILTTVYIVIAK